MSVRARRRASSSRSLRDAIRSRPGQRPRRPARLWSASRGTSGLGALSEWWIRWGVRYERIDAGNQKQSGGHERFRRTLPEARQTACADRAAQERRFLAFARDYNEERPHEALGQQTPASVYRPSPRAMPERLPEPTYPAEAAVRKVRSTGEIEWQGTLIYVCSTLIGEAVAVEETETGDWQVRFFDAPIGVIDRLKRKLRRAAVPVHGDGSTATHIEP